MFLNILLNEQGKVDDDTKNDSLGISLSCGHYSYAEIIKKFNKIFGVSGTL